MYVGKVNSGGKKDGFGIKNWKDGAIYIGMWEQGKANGKGWYFNSLGEMYHGEFVDDKFCG